MDGISNQFNQWTAVLFNSTNEFFRTVAEYLPKLIGALILLFLGILIAGFLRRAVQSLVDKLNLERITGQEVVNDRIRAAGVSINIKKLIGGAVYWAVFLIFLMAVADVLELSVVQDTIGALIGYIDNVIAAVIVMMLTIAAANIVEDVIKASLTGLSLEYTTWIAKAAEVVILVFGTVIAANQLIDDLTLITANLTLIVAGIVTALALAFGLGGRDAAGDLVSSMLVKNSLTVGQRISVNGRTGEVKEINRIGVLLNTGKEDVLVPHKEIV